MSGRDPILVVIPTRDRPEFLLEALRSVLAQTDPDFVVAVADDGAGELVERDPAMPVDGRIAFVGTQAGTAGGARNAAFAHGEARVLGRPAGLVAFLDDDDLWKPDHLARARAALAAAPDAAFVHGAAITVGEKGETPYQERDDGPFEGDLFAALLRRNFVATSSVVARAAAVRGAGGFRADVSHGEDHGLWLELARRGRVAWVPEPTVVYRDHGGNVSRHLVAKARDQAEVMASWWPRRSRLSAAERAVLRRELARRHRRHVRRLLDEHATPRREIRALARRRFAEVPHHFTLRAVFEATFSF